MFKKEEETPSSMEALLTLQTKDALVFRVGVKSGNFFLDHGCSKSAVLKEKSQTSGERRQALYFP